VRWTRDKIRALLSEIKSRGFIRTKRKGPTGVGYTLEILLGIDENNLYLPDIGEFELKARREGHSGLTTLFTFNRAAWKMDPMTAIKRYGSEDRDGRLGLYQSVTSTPNPRGFQVSVDEGSICVNQSVDQNIILEWSLSDVVQRFTDKLNNLLLVKAIVEEREGVEYFNYHQATLLSGSPSQKILRTCIQDGDIVIDLRLHDKGTKGARNHGTGFRVREESLELLFEISIDLEI